MHRSDVTIFAILNVTEDSFSDGGRYLETSAAIDRALALGEAGADVLDIGAASSHPEARSVTAAEEIDRLAPVVDALAGRVLVSIDSWQPQVQRWAMQQKVAWLNDIRGFAFSEIYESLAASDCGLVLMHSVAETDKAQRENFPAADVLDRIEKFFTARVDALTTAGVDPSRIVLDPGMGLFLGSDPEASLVVLRNIARLKAEFRNELLISVSRKSVVGAVSGRAVDQRLAAGLAMELFAVEQGARFIRTHEPAALSDALRALEILRPVG